MGRKRRTKGKGKAKSILPLLVAVIFFCLGVLSAYLWDRFREGTEPIVPEPIPAEAPTPEGRGQKPLPIPVHPPKPEKSWKAAIAIIIDDIGYKKKDVERFSSLPYPLALSIIPYTPFDVFSARYAKKHGKSVMLHIPMEPNHTSEIIEKLEKKTFGMLLTRMPDSTIRAMLKKELSRVPFAVAANNHMGSRFTQNRHKMRIVLNFLREHSLFFVDSRTSPKSVACSVGKSVGVVVLKRNIFLDNSKSKDYIKRQLDILAQRALKRGYAIAIGHPHLATYQALMEKLPELEKRGVKVIPIERIYQKVVEGEYEACL